MGPNNIHKVVLQNLMQSNPDEIRNIVCATTHSEILCKTNHNGTVYPNKDRESK
jgi:hypothetical protein